MNNMGMNIPYPYELPILTTGKRLGFWTLVGAMERLIEDGKHRKGEVYSSNICET